MVRIASASAAVDIDHYRTFLDLAHPQDSDLRLIDNRETIEIALAPRIRQRERAASEIINAE